MPSFKRLLSCLSAALLMVSCHHAGWYTKDTPPRAVVKDGVAITVCDQKLTVFRDGKKVKDYDVSTSKFGLGSANGSKRTPVGIHAVSEKTGEGQPKGMVFKGARPTGEVVAPNSPGRDPVVTRVIQLSGLERSNSNSHSRRIYIHGTPEERKIGRPASYGCIRMRSDDVVDLFSRVHRGMPVAIETCTQKTYLKAEQDAQKPNIQVPASIVASLPHDNHLKAVGNSPRRLAATRKTSRASTRLATRKVTKRSRRRG